MNKTEILDLFKGLAHSQGLYCRILQAIRENPEEGTQFLTALEEKHFKDSIELIMYLES